MFAIQLNKFVDAVHTFFYETGNKIRGVQSVIPATTERETIERKTKQDFYVDSETNQRFMHKPHIHALFSLRHLFRTSNFLSRIRWYHRKTTIQSNEWQLYSMFCRLMRQQDAIWMRTSVCWRVLNSLRRTFSMTRGIYGKHMQNNCCLISQMSDC